MENQTEKFAEAKRKAAEAANRWRSEVNKRQKKAREQGKEEIQTPWEMRKGE